MTQAGWTDVHHHYLPPRYVAALEEAGLSPPDGMAATPAWSEADALGAMDRLGIAKAYLSISSPGVHFGNDAKARALARAVNEDAAELKARHPARFGFFACTPLPDIAAALDEISHAYEHLDADGVVFETNFHGLYLGDAALAPVYADLDRRKAVLFLHPTQSPCRCYHAPDGSEQTIALGYPAPLLEFLFDTTRTVIQMIVSGTLARHSSIRLIVPHAGAMLPMIASRVELMVDGLGADPAAPRNIHAALRELHYDLAGAPVPDQLAALLRIADPGKLHYGSDWPFTPVQTCERLLSLLKASDLLDAAALEAVGYGNAGRLFEA